MVEVRQGSWGQVEAEPVLGLLGGVRGVGRAVVKGVESASGRVFARMLETVMMSRERGEERCEGRRCRRCGYVECEDVERGVGMEVEMGRVGER